MGRPKKVVKVEVNEPVLEPKEDLKEEAQELTTYQARGLRQLKDKPKFPGKP